MAFLTIALGILTAILWIWAFVDILKSRFDNPMSNGIWIVLILLFPILGSIIYFQLGKNYKKDSKKFNPDFSRSY